MIIETHGIPKHPNPPTRKQPKPSQNPPKTPPKPPHGRFGEGLGWFGGCVGVFLVCFGGFWDPWISIAVKRLNRDSKRVACWLVLWGSGLPARPFAPVRLETCELHGDTNNIDWVLQTALARSPVAKSAGQDHERFLRAIQPHRHSRPEAKLQT